MTDSQKISPEFGLMEVSGSISDPRGPKTRKTTSERNHNPVSRHFALLENMGSESSARVDSVSFIELIKNRKHQSLGV